MVDRPEVQLDELYREVVMDHHRHPRGRTPLDRVDARAHGFNPVCGDEVRLGLAVEGERVAGVELAGPFERRPSPGSQYHDSGIAARLPRHYDSGV